MPAKLMKLSLWLAREFESGSIPDKRTAKKWIENGRLKGRIVDGQGWVVSSERWGVSSVVASRVQDLISAGVSNAKAAH